MNFHESFYHFLSKNYEVIWSFPDFSWTFFQLTWNFHENKWSFYKDFMNLFSIFSSFWLKLFQFSHFKKIKSFHQNFHGNFSNFLKIKSFLCNFPKMVYIFQSKHADDLSWQIRKIYRRCNLIYLQVAFQSAVGSAYHLPKSAAKMEDLLSICGRNGRSSAETAVDLTDDLSYLPTDWKCNLQGDQICRSSELHGRSSGFPTLLFVVAIF